MGMLSAKDIMVGDYICGILGNMRVVSIGKSTVTGQWADKNDPDVIHKTNCVYKAVCPIPISVEILQANNYKETYTSAMSRVWDIAGEDDDDNDISLRYSICANTWFISAMGLKETIQIKKHIKYVHELQHILALYGIYLSDDFKFE